MKPKLLLVADTYYPKVDGTLKFMEEFIRRASDDFHITLLVPHLGQRKNQNTIFLDTSSWLNLSGYPSIKFSRANLHKIKKAVQNADIVFIQGPALLSYLCMYFAPKYHQKTIFYIHVLSWELFAKFVPAKLHKPLLYIIKWLSIRLYNRCSKILVPYRELQEYLQQQGVSTNVTVARLGVDIERFIPEKEKEKAKRKLGIDPAKKVIGYVGRISKEKNTKVLVDAFRRLKHQDKLFLLMVGDGPQEQTKECKELFNCRVTGFVDNVEDYLKAMDIFIMPSLTETTSLATLEAMASGLPIIATKVGFIKSYIVKDYNGLFFPRRSPGLLADKITKLLANKQLRDHLGQNARKTVAYSFSWERSINKIKRLLVKTLSHS